MIAIFDYGAGNLRSVQNTLGELGCEYTLVRDAAGLGAASKILLPGVGHFGQMMRALDSLGVRETLVERIRAGVPFLGICLGMQVAVVEFARTVVGLEGANSSEFDPATPYPVIDLLPEQKGVSDMGGTMRLGSDPVTLADGTLAQAAYGEPVVYERHRHRYEVNNSLRPNLVAQGLVVSGTSPDERLVEIIELPDHPWFCASQFHPEFKSRPNRPQPLFRDFVGAAVALRDGRPAASAPVAENLTA